MHNINHSVAAAHSKSPIRRKRPKKKLTLVVKALIILLLLYIGFFSGSVLIGLFWWKKEDRRSASLSSSWRTSKQGWYADEEESIGELLSRWSNQSYKTAQASGVHRKILKGETLSKYKKPVPSNNDSGTRGKSVSERVKEMNFTNASFATLYMVKNQVEYLNDRVEYLNDQVDYLNKSLESLRRSEFRKNSSIPIIEEEVRVKEVNFTKFAVLYMVKDRVEYLKNSLESLRRSDFPKNSSIPIIFSHDGHVPEMMSFVDSLRDEFNIIQIFHPHACYDNPYSFPANDTSLNEGYKGDKYGNPRSGWATCAKHHWWWMANRVWSMVDIIPEYVFFMEEDYEVAPTIFETIISGLSLLKASKKGDYFGLTLEVGPNELGITSRLPEGWFERPFTSSPMVIDRYALERIHENADEFCTFDDYNWDWSIVQLQQLRKVPGKVLCPTISQVKHIGHRGMHGDTDVPITKLIALKSFQGKDIVRRSKYWAHAIVNGGWGHTMDHNHCIQVAKNTTDRPT